MRNTDTCLWGMEQAGRLPAGALLRKASEIQSRRARERATTALYSFTYLFSARMKDTHLPRCTPRGTRGAGEDDKALSRHRATTARVTRLAQIRQSHSRLPATLSTWARN